MHIPDFKNEASLHTARNGQELQLHIPDDAPFTPMMKFLSACLMRAENDLGWWEEQVAWAEREAYHPALLAHSTKPIAVKRAE